MKQSTAAVFDGTAGKLQLRRFALPEPAAGEMLVRVLGCTLCASDLHSFEGRRSVPIPTVLGHEIVGEIVRVGDGKPAVDLAGNPIGVGDRVTWAIVASCGECFFCRRGLPQKCVRATKYGHESLKPGCELLGGLAEHCLLVAGTSPVLLPAELSLEVACPASCATATVAAALEAAGNLREANVCLFGAGMLGLTAAAMARWLGAASVVCVDPDAARRARAMQFGATAAIDPADVAGFAPDGKERYGFDAVVELSGNPAAVEAVIASARIGGSVVLVGSVFPTRGVEVLPEQIVRRQLTLRGVHNYAPRNLLAAVQFLAEEHRRWPFAELVSDWLPLDRATEAFERSAREKAIRIGVKP
jgi:alcohol dehydrogenase